MIFRHPRVICATSLGLRNMSFDYGPSHDSLVNRQAFLGPLGIDYRALACCRQVHGDTIKIVNGSERGSGALGPQNAITDTDALITDTPNLPLAIFTADCLPVFLYDPGRHALGLAHAGRRGTHSGIAASAARLMQKSFGTRFEDLLIGFGPAIRGCCYEVGDDVGGLFASGVSRRDKRLFLDLAAVNRKQLLELGAEESRIADAGLCTCCQGEEFFSFRRQGASCGRMISVAMLRQ
jgi:polyphenol oxidase